MIRLGPIRSRPRGALVVSPGELDPRRFRRGLVVVRPDGTRVGTTYDVIGNVSSPYIVVKLDQGVEVPPGQELYVVIPPAPPARRRGRRWRKG
ncbi:MAG: H/ACA ribonucleoprotein complex subunit GAR1 [Acidilobus sp.]